MNTIVDYMVCMTFPGSMVSYYPSMTLASIQTIHPVFPINQVKVDSFIFLTVEWSLPMTKK